MPPQRAFQEFLKPITWSLKCIDAHSHQHACGGHRGKWVVQPAAGSSPRPADKKPTHFQIDHTPQYAPPEIVDIGDLVDLTAQAGGKDGATCDGLSGLTGNKGKGNPTPCVGLTS